jgi:hypothetical protein
MLGVFEKQRDLGIRVMLLKIVAADLWQKYLQVYYEIHKAVTVTLLSPNVCSKRGEIPIGARRLHT